MTLLGLMFWALILYATYNIGKMRGLSTASKAYRKTLEAMWEGKIK